MTVNGQHAVPMSKGQQAVEPSLGQLVSDASASVSTLIQSEIQLAKLELRSSAKSGGMGAGLLAAAAALLVFSLTFLFIGIAELLVMWGVWRWLAYLCVFAFFTVVAGVLALVGIKKLKKVKAPEKTIATSKDTVAYLKANTGSH